MNIAIILAGGIGSRVGEETPKQFIEVLGKPIIAYTIEKFQNHREIDAIEVVCLDAYKEKCIELCSKYTKVKWIVSGGKDFQHSVLNGINELNGKLEEDDNVLIHYAASPFVENEIISDAIKVCDEKGNATSATPFFLLAGSNDDGIKSTKWIDRDKVMGLNVPHVYKFAYITGLYRRAVEQKLLDKVEPHTTSLMYALGETIYFSKGNQTNIKITTKEDVKLFEGYVLRERMER